MACGVLQSKQNLTTVEPLFRGAGSVRPRRGAPEGQGRAGAPRREKLSRPAYGADTVKSVIFSLGVIHPKHLRGRSFTNMSMRLNSFWPIPANEDFFGWSRRISPLVFSFVPRSHEW